MENQKNNKGVITLLVVIIIILSVLCVLFATDTISFNSDANDNTPIDNDVNNDVDGDQNNNDIDNDQENNDNQESNYNFGDQITISKLASVADYSVAGNVDLSKWHVLADNGVYLTLMSDQIFVKIDSKGDNNVIQVAKNMLEKNGINFGSNGEIRIINENDLKNYFNCNLNTLTCNPTKSWFSSLNSEYTSTLTSVKHNEKIVIINFDNSLELLDSGAGLVPWYPVIKILKSSI